MPILIKSKLICNGAKQFIVPIKHAKMNIFLCYCFTLQLSRPYPPFDSAKLQKKSMVHFMQSQRKYFILIKTINGIINRKSFFQQKR